MAKNTKPAQKPVKPMDKDDCKGSKCKGKGKDKGC